MVILIKLHSMCNHFLKNFVSLFSYSLLFLLGFFFIFPSIIVLFPHFLPNPFVICFSKFPFLFPFSPSSFLPLLFFSPFFPSFLLSSLPSRGRWMPSQSLLSEVSSCKSFFPLYDCLVYAPRELLVFYEGKFLIYNE